MLLARQIRASMYVHFESLDGLANWVQWLASPACTELEAVMMDWSAKLLGLSPAFLNESAVGGGVMMVC